MAFLRFSRDKRGYETTALVHAFRRHGRSNPRILYWFRTPVDARVGRTALDEDAIRLLEQHHPGLLFDWVKILEMRPPAEPEQVAGHRTGRALERRAAERRRAAPVVDADSPPVAARPADGIDAAAEAEPPDERVVPSAQSRFSPEDLARLRGRHAALLARIAEEVDDVERSQALRARAEALDPDTWVTPDEVREALERYEQVYRELREALGRRKRRPRRTDGDHEPPQVV